MLSGVSKDSFEEERGVTCTDIKLIMPTVLILLFTLFIMVTVIPYAFSSVIKQLQAVWALEEQCESKPELPSTGTNPMNFEFGLCYIAHTILVNRRKLVK